MKTSQAAVITVIVLAVIVLAGNASTAKAHELLIKLQSPPTAGQPLTFTVSNGDIDKSINNTPWDAVEDVSIASARSVAHLAEPEWNVADKTSGFRHTFTSNGPYLLGVSTKPKIFEFSGPEFADYLKEEHIEISGGKTPDRPPGAPIRERYSKHALAYVQLGAPAAKHSLNTLGYPVEVRLQADPARLRPGDVLRVQVIAFGKPAANQIVLGGYEGYGHNAKGEPTNLLNLRTDKQGYAEFKISTAGRWALYLVNMKAANDPTFDVESHYATVLFDISGKVVPRGFPAPR